MVRQLGMVYLDWLQAYMTAEGIVDVVEVVRGATKDVSCSSTADTCMQVSSRTPAASSESSACVQAEHLPDDPWAGLV